MGVLKSILEWWKYERLAHYPELAHLNRDVALKRLRAIEKVVSQERRSARLRAIPWILGGWAAIVALLIYGHAPLHFPLWFALVAYPLVLNYADYRVTRRRIRALIHHERWGRPPDSCVECGYDMRGSPSSTCPECGFDSLTKPRGYE